MPQHAKNPEHRWYFYPVEPPETVLDWQLWPTHMVCIPAPLISYLLNVMRVYEWEGRVKTDDPAKAQAFVEAWKGLIADIAVAEECNPMPYPIFRMNPLNGCQMQQSIDNGETWVTVLDTSACFVPADPAPQMIQLRQSPTNPAILQQSLNGGSSWSTAYDYSKYRPQSIVQEHVLYNQTTEIVNTYIQTWNNNPTVNEFAPQMVYDSGSTPANDQRDAAICYAISAWYDIAKQAAVAYVANQNDGLAAFASSVVGAGVGMVGTPVAGVLAAAVVGALVKGISLVGAATQESNYTAAKNDIVCCMYEGLQGATLTRERFQASLSGCGFAGGSNSEAIRAVIHALVQDLDVYVTFLRAAAEWFNYAEFSELPDCLCDEPPPTDTPNFSVQDAFPILGYFWLGGGTRPPVFVGNPSPGFDTWDIPFERTIDDNYQSSVVIDPVCQVTSVTVINGTSGINFYQPSPTWTTGTNHAQLACVKFVSGAGHEDVIRVVIGPA